MLIPIIISTTPKINSIEVIWKTSQTTVKDRSITFHVEYSINNGNTWIYYQNTKNKSIIINNLSSENIYIIRVYASGIYGTSYSSASSSIVPLSATPSKPLNLRVQNNGSQKVLITWDKPKDSGISPIKEYKIEYSADNGLNWITINNINSAIFKYVIDNLIDGTTYLFKVYAKNDNDWGPPISSNPIIVFGLPSAPINFNGIGQNNSALVSWTPPTNNGGKPIVEYSIQCAAFDNRTDAEIFMSNINNNNINRVKPLSVINFKFLNNNTTSIVVPNLTNGLFYALRIRAFNVANIQGLAGVVSSFFSNKIIIRPQSVSSKPTNLQITNIGDSTISLSWLAPINTGGIPLMHYIVQYYDGNEWLLYQEKYNIDTFATINNLTNSTTYTFRVAAVNDAGLGEWSDISMSASPGSSPPNAPTSVTGLPKHQKVVLSWTPPVSEVLPITAYTVQYAEYSNDNPTSLSLNWQTYRHTFPTYTNIVIDGLENGTNYIFRVAAINLVGTGPYSENSSPISPSPSAPQAPSNLEVKAFDESVLLSWIPPSDNGGSPLVSYTIDKSQNGGDTWTEAAVITNSHSTNYVSGTMHAIDNLINNITYIFRIKATNAFGSSAFVLSDPVTPFADPNDILFDNNNLENLVLPYVASGTLGLSDAYFFIGLIELAAARLKQYIKYNPSVVQAIQSKGVLNALGNAPWQGAYLNRLRLVFWEPIIRNEYVIASAGLNSQISLSSQIHGLPGVAANAISYSMTINVWWKDYFTQDNWIDIITHELCHGLGFGVYWDPMKGGPRPEPTLEGSKRPSFRTLSGSDYPQTQQAYNEITGLSRSHTPVLDGGGPGTNGLHWESNYRPSDPNGSAMNPTRFQNFYGVVNELMIGYAPEPGFKHILSDLTIKHFVDLGYQETNPGTNEGKPFIKTNFGILSQSNTNMRYMTCNHCYSCDTNKIINNIGLFDIDKQAFIESGDI